MHKLVPIYRQTPPDRFPRFLLRTFSRLDIGIQSWAAAVAAAAAAAAAALQHSNAAVLGVKRGRNEQAAAMHGHAQEGEEEEKRAFQQHQCASSDPFHHLDPLHQQKLQQQQQLPRCVLWAGERETSSLSPT